MDTLDMTGQACPIPVIQTKKALEASAPGTRLTVVVDNATAVENLAKFASQRGYGFERGEASPGRFDVVLTSADAQSAGSASNNSGRRSIVVAVSSKTMGEGDERLGATLLKGFLYALTESSTWPDAVLFYNGGAHLTTPGSESVDDLRKLEDGGVEILTCGTCVNHYGLPAPTVGGVTNMYSIVEKLTSADTVIKP